MSKLSNLVTNEVVRKTEYNKLVAKVNAIPLNHIDTSRFVLKTKYDTDKSEFLILAVLLKRQIIILKSLK